MTPPAALATSPGTPGMQRTLPEGWRWARLGDVCDFIRGVSFDKSDVRYEATPDHVPILRAGNIQEEIDVRNDLVWVPSTHVDSEQRLRVGDIAICMSSGSALVVGKSARLREAWDGSIGAFCGIIRARESECADFIAYWFRSASFIDWRDEQARGANIQNLRFSQLEDLTLALPPLVEQRRMAARLSEQMAHVARARAAAEERIAAARRLSLAHLRGVFEGPNASHWEKVPVGNIANVCGGVQKQPNRSAHTFHRPYLTVRNVQRGSLDLSHVERFEITPTELERLRLHRGDILIVEGNGSPDQIGRNAIFDLDGEEWVHQNHVIRVRLSNRAESLFVSKYLNSDAGRRQMLERAQSTSGLHTLSVEKVKSLVVPLPPLPEQRRIAARLNEQMQSASAIHTSIERELAKINALPAALLRDAFGERNGEA